jgi:hypothetical protein
MSRHAEAISLARAVAFACAAAACGRVGYDPPDFADAGDAALLGDVSPVADAEHIDVARDDMLEEDAPPLDSQPDDAGPDADAPDAGTSCPIGISFGPGTMTPLRGNPSGGTASLDACPSGQVVVGYRLDPDRNNGVIGKLTTLCGAVALDPVTCQPRIAAGATLPTRGRQSTNVPVAQACASDQIIVGIRAQSNQDLDQAAFGCATLTISPSGFTYAASTGPITWFPPVGGPRGFPSEDVCPSGQVAIGSFIRASVWIEGFALVCAAPIFAP